MSRRAATLLVASVLILVLGSAGSFLPVPYVALTPGPTTNTLGKTAKGEPFIQIEGRQTYDDAGNLNFTTVAYRGGPGNRLDLFTALRGWLDDETAIVPEETIFPDDESPEQVEEENSRQMQESQELAVAAALTELKIPVTATVQVQSVQRGLPADGELKPGDELVEVAGAKASSVRAVTDVMAARQPGTPVTVKFRRDGAEQQVDITPAASKDDGKRAVLGVVLGAGFDFPFKVEISVGDVGGPSAGLMFALGIIDRLTPGPLTGGEFIAGTGTITPEGQVGPIGGIQQKMIAAREAGATVFLTPKDNCDSARRAVPDGLRLVRADTLNQTVQSLEALRTGQGAVPSCDAS